MSSVAIVPARGGSKRIPHKNVRPFLGTPIIGYPIRAAVASGLFDAVIVSTDDPGIAEVARAHGAQTPFTRPAELADDHTGTNAVVRHALRWLEQQGRLPELACCIYATAPFVRAQDLAAGREALRRSGKAYAFSVTSYEFPVQRALRAHADGTLEPLYPQYAETRSQDLAETCHDAGQFYWGRSAAFLEDLPLYSRHAVGVPIPRYRVQDIDTVEDWRRAELMFELLQRGEE